MILDIRKYPDKLLRKKCRTISYVDAEIRRLFDDMLMTMRSVNGIGLAAPQIGLDVQLIVVDIGDGPLKLANPRIVDRKGVSVLEEGCLSLPGINVKVKRAANIKVCGLDSAGKEQLFEASGLFAHVVQHEIEHLDGKLLIDYLPLYKKFFIKRKIKG
jgi:peptide deformylase